nr:hypothetical protein Iba_chr14fCG8710 [Ipomoea batatas]
MAYDRTSRRKLFLMLLLILPRGVLPMGDANDMDRPLSGEMDGPNRADEWTVGPTFDVGVSVNDRYQGLRESLWCDTLKANLEDEHGPPILVVDDVTDEGFNLNDVALG